MHTVDGIFDASEDDKKLTVSETVYATTPGKNCKDIYIYQHQYYWKVRFGGGGQLPRELSGTWTNYSAAAWAVDMYLLTFKEKRRGGRSVNSKEESVNE